MILRMFLFIGIGLVVGGIIGLIGMLFVRGK